MDAPRENTEIIRLQKKYEAKLLCDRFSPETEHTSTGNVFRQAEAMNVKSQMNSYRTKINELERYGKRARIEYENDIDANKMELKSYKDENERLRLELDVKTSRLMKSRIDLEEMTEKLHKCTRQYEAKVAKLGKEWTAMEEERDTIREAKNQLENDKTKEIWRLEKERDTLTLDKEQAEETYKLEQRRTSELKSKLQSAENKLCDVSDLHSQIKELQKFHDQYEEDGIMLKNLKNEYKNFPQVMKEYAILKTNNENCLLLKEECEKLSEQCERLEARVQQLDTVDVENEELHRKLRVWTEKASPVIDRPRSMDDLLHQLATLQNSEAVLVENQSKLQTRVKLVEKTLQDKETDLSVVSRKYSQSQQIKSSLEDKLRRMERKLTLFKAERDSYRDIIDSYERDCTITLPPSLSSQTELQHGRVVSEVESQCHDLEKQLDAKRVELQAAVDKIEQMELKEKQSISSQKDSVVSETDKQVILQLRDQVSQLEKKLETVSEEKFQVESILEKYNIQGAYDPRTTKVVQLCANPTSLSRTERNDEIKSLKEENQRLAKRVEILEENEGLVADLTLQVESNVKRDSCNSQELDEMKVKMESANLTNERLVEVFKKTSQDLRMACYCLTGYQINVLSTSNYRVTHMMSDSPEDYLLFRQDTPGNLQLLETTYSSTLSDLMDTYLTKQHSLPAFMSALTLDLFNKRTTAL